MEKKVSARAFIPHLIPIGHLAASEHDRLHIVAFIERFRSHAERFLWKRELFLLFGVYSVFYDCCYCDVDGGWRSRRIGECRPNRRYLPFFVFGFIRIRNSFFQLLILLVWAARRHTGFGSPYLLQHPFLFRPLFCCNIWLKRVYWPFAPNAFGGCWRAVLLLRQPWPQRPLLSNECECVVHIKLFMWYEILLAIVGR